MAFHEAVWFPLQSLIRGIVDFIPGFVGALIVLIVGYLIASGIHWMVEKLLLKLKADRLVEKTNLSSVLGRGFRLSHLLGLLSKWYVFILFIPPAADLIRLRALSDFLNYVAQWIPNVIASVLIALIGLMAADYVANKIVSTKAKFSSPIALGAKVLIIIFTVLVVLRQIGIAVAIAEQSWLVLLAGAVLAAALAIGIGFGLALKEEARGILKKFEKRL